MKTNNSVTCALNLAKALEIDELPLNDRSDKWWDMFWKQLGLEEAKRIKEGDNA